MGAIMNILILVNSDHLSDVRVTHSGFSEVVDC